jgi:ATP-dependent DNA helicase RecQ
VKTPPSKTSSKARKPRAAQPAGVATASAAARPRRAAARTATAEIAAKPEPKSRAKAAAKPRAKAAAPEAAAKTPRTARSGKAAVEKPSRGKAAAKVAKPEKPAKAAATRARAAKVAAAETKPAPRRRKAAVAEAGAPAPEAQQARAFAAAPAEAVAPQPAAPPMTPEPPVAPAVAGSGSSSGEAGTAAAVSSPEPPYANGSAAHFDAGADLEDNDWDEGAASEISLDDVLAADDAESDADDDEDEDDAESAGGDSDDDADGDDEDDDEDEDDADDELELAGTVAHGAAPDAGEDDAGEDDAGKDDAGEDDADEDDEHDDTPLGESVTTEAGGGLDPALAAAARRLGIQRLYPEQERTIREVLDAHDVLIVMPTGFGKSACYQVPSMLLPSPVVLISPLLALLKDQHEKLIKHNVPCVRVDGTVRGRARTEAMERIAKGGPLLVMTTPETLGSEEMYHVLTKSGISLAAIDEAHCISEWGFDFRPAYLRLGETLRKLGRPPLLALTATATEKVRTDIVRFLGMRTPTIVASSPHRSNLAFEVLECREAARLRALARLAQRLRRPGIIYCSTTRDVDTVYTILMRLGIPAHRYHGKMTAGDRVKQQEMYMKPGRRTVMVATSAFGLGIDKPDIRYVVHQQSPASLEQYVQEAGRAGRDGAKANCILLHDSSDRTVHEALLSRSRLRPDQLYKLGSALAAWAAEGRTPTIDALALSADLGERPTNALLATLEEAGLVKISEDFLVRATCAPAEVEEKVRSLAGQFANMRTQDSRRLDAVADYAQDGGCRAVYLRSYFGEDGGGACGLCDVCRGRPDRPSTFWSPVAAPKRMNKKRRRGRGGQQQPQQQRAGGGGRRRRGRRRRGGGQQNPQQMNLGQGGPNGQQRQQPRPQHRQPQQHGGGPQQNPNQMGGGANDGQRRRRRRRRGRRGRRGRPNPSAPTPTPTSEG